MILIEEHHSIFIATPRCGTTSVFTALKPFGAVAVLPEGTESRIPVYDHIDGFHSPHVPDEFRHFRVVGGVRNPFSRMVSHFLFAKRSRGHRWRKFTRQGFRRFILRVFDSGSYMSQHEMHHISQPDFVMKFEDPIAVQLQSGFPNIPIDLDEYPHINKTNYKRHWSSWYSDVGKMKKIVEYIRRVEGPTFERFGYPVNPLELSKPLSEEAVYPSS